MLRMISSEAIGTFFLALIIATTRVTNLDGSAPFAIGFGLVAIIYITAPVSGAQLNPAVTLGLLVSNNLPLLEAVCSVAAQVFGALIAGLVAFSLYDEHWDRIGYPSVHDKQKRSEAFTAEVLTTFILMLTVLNTAKAPATANNSYFGLAIGFVVLSGALVIGGISGACFNPAISVLTVLHGDAGDLWVFLCGPLLGALFAGLQFRFCRQEYVLFPLIVKLVQEFIGTFFISWTAALAANASLSAGNFALGCIIVALVYGGGHISGAHYNPSVTIGVYLRGLMDPPHLLHVQDMLCYIVVQIGGAFAGGGMAAYVQGSKNDISSPSINTDEHTKFAALMTEFAFTFALVLCVLMVATNYATKGNEYFGTAIGFTVTAGAIAVGDISGGVLNPAVAIALPSISGHHTSDIIVYVIGEMLGGMCASVVYVMWTMPLTEVERERAEKRRQKSSAGVAKIGERLSSTDYDEYDAVENTNAQRGLMGEYDIQ